MKELSLNILDAAMNSLRAGATLVSVAISETASALCITVADNGCGIPDERLCRLRDPFFTTRPGRGIGLGVPLFALAAEQTGGGLAVTSRHIAKHPKTHGTVIRASFNKDSIDMTPLGDIASTVVAAVSYGNGADIIFRHETPLWCILFDTRALRCGGRDADLSSPAVLSLIDEYIRGQYVGLCPENEK